MSKKPFPDSVQDSAQQIWLAGLGAFTKAQEEGSKVFDALVKEGLTMQQKTQAAAEAKLAEATQKMSSMASEISNRASGQWGKLESIFEERVAKALSQLGVPSQQEVQALRDRVEALEKQLGEGAAKKPPRKST